MTTIQVCDICNEPVRVPIEMVTAAIRTHDRNAEYHFHRSCFEKQIPGLWALAGTYAP